MSLLRLLSKFWDEPIVSDDFLVKFVLNFFFFFVLDLDLLVSFDESHLTFSSDAFPATNADAILMIVDIAAIGAEPISLWTVFFDTRIRELVFVVISLAILTFILYFWVDFPNIHGISDLIDFIIFGRASLTNAMIEVIIRFTFVFGALPKVTSLMFGLPRHRQLLELVLFAFFPHFLLVSIGGMFEFEQAIIYVTIVEFQTLAL